VADKMIKATLMKSAIGARPEIKATVESLGFRKMNQTRELPDNPAVRGMLRRVDFLVAVEASRSSGRSAAATRSGVRARRKSTRGATERCSCMT